MDTNQPQNQPQNSQQSQRFSMSKKPDGTLDVKITVPASDVEVARKAAVDELVKNVEVPGFRKGAAPRNLAEQKLNHEQVKQEVLRKLITDEYVKAVKALSIRPIINPRVHIEAFEDGTDLTFSAETCEEPKVELGNYKEAVKKIKPQAPTGPLQQGQAAPLKGAQNQPQNPNPTNKKLDEVLNTILTTAKIQIPRILVEQEADRLLSQLLDELKRLGVSLDQYLASRQKTTESLRAEYEDRANKDLQLEFVLRKIADEEKIVVVEEDVRRAMSQIKDENERRQISQNPYLVGAIIRQQKTLDFLSKL